MKNTMKLWGMIALAAVIGFTMTACPTEDDGGGPSSFLGPDLELKGQVWDVDINEDDFIVTYTPYNSPVTISDIGSGSVTDGYLNYTITGAPAGLESLEDYLEYFYFWDNIQVSSSGVQGYLLSGLSVTSPNTYDALRKSYSTMKINYNTFTASGSDEAVMYIYVDSDVTITGKGIKDVEAGIDADTGLPYTNTFITNSFNLALKKGWNALHEKVSITMRITATATAAITETVTISMANPAHLRWTLDDGAGSSGYGSSGSILVLPQELRSLSGSFGFNALKRPFIFYP